MTLLIWLYKLRDASGPDPLRIASHCYKKWFASSQPVTTQREVQTVLISPLTFVFPPLTHVSMPTLIAYESNGFIFSFPTFWNVSIIFRPHSFYRGNTTTSKRLNFFSFAHLERLKNGLNSFGQLLWFSSLYDNWIIWSVFLFLLLSSDKSLIYSLVFILSFTCPQHQSYRAGLRYYQMSFTRSERESTTLITSSSLLRVTSPNPKSTGTASIPRLNGATTGRLQVTG